MHRCICIGDDVTGDTISPVAENTGSVITILIADKGSVTTEPVDFLYSHGNISPQRKVEL